GPARKPDEPRSPPCENAAILCAGRIHSPRWRRAGAARRSRPAQLQAFFGGPCPPYPLVKPARRRRGLFLRGVELRQVVRLALDAHQVRVLQALVVVDVEGLVLVEV